MSKEGMGGTIVLGLAGVALGAFVVNYAFADEGNSWYDQLADKFKGAGGGGAGGAGSGGGGGAFKFSQGGGGSGAAQAVMPFSSARPASPDLIREVQARLNSFGFSSLAGVRKLPLSLDGILGPDTRTFLAVMQHQWQMPASGYPDPDTVRVLRSMTSPDRSKGGGTASMQRRGAPARSAIPGSHPSTIPGSHPSTTPGTVSALHPMHPAAHASHPSSVHPLSHEELGEIAMMLDEVFHLGLGEHMRQTGQYPALAEIQGLLSSFQHQAGLPATGQFDDATYKSLVQAANHASAMAGQVPSAAHHLTGYVARAGYVGAGGGGWESEVSSLGSEAHDVIAHALSSETNAHVLTSLGKALSAAGFPTTAAAVSAKSGGATATSGQW